MVMKRGWMMCKMKMINVWEDVGRVDGVQEG